MAAILLEGPEEAGTTRRYYRSLDGEKWLVEHDGQEVFEVDYFTSKLLDLLQPPRSEVLPPLPRTSITGQELRDFLKIPDPDCEHCGDTGWVKNGWTGHNTPCRHCDAI